MTAEKQSNSTASTPQPVVLRRTRQRPVQQAEPERHRQIRAGEEDSRLDAAAFDGVDGRAQEREDDE